MSNSRIKTVWTNHLKDEKDKQKFKEYVINSSSLLDKLIEICYNGIKEAENVGKDSYESPSWAYRQAHDNGRREAFKEIIEICTITERT